MENLYLEAQNTIAAFGDGTAEAKSFTISFYVKASIATTYCLHVATSHLSTSKGYLKQFTVNSANTWERKTCTIQAITNSIGTVNGLDNGTGIRIHWVLDAPTRASSQAADTWFTFTDGDFGYPTGQGPTGYANTLNATFELGGVQVEAGSVATDLEHRSFAQELLLCQRYCQVFGGVTNYTLFGTGVWKSSTVASIGFPFMTKMRSQPSFSVTSPTNSMVRSGGTNIDVTTLALDINTKENVMYNANVSSGGTNGHGAMHLGKGNTDTTITLSAEL